MGLFLTVLAFCIPAWVQTRIDAGESPVIAWQILAYFVLTSAEVMVSITSLEFSYTQAPREMKSFIMGLYLLSVTLGNIFVAQVNGYIESSATISGWLHGANYYWFFTGCMLVMAVLYVVWSPWYRGRTYIQGDTDEPHAPGKDTLSPQARLEP